MTVAGTGGTSMGFPGVTGSRPDRAHRGRGGTVDCNAGPGYSSLGIIAWLGSLLMSKETNSSWNRTTCPHQRGGVL